MISVSIVSHSHGVFLEKLINDLIDFPCVNQIILTFNLSESFDFKFNSNDIINIIHNKAPLGFGQNHNNAFLLSTQPYFCVLNPDIEFIKDPFPELIKSLQYISNCLVAPLIISSDYSVEDSARYFPTYISLLQKLFFSYDGRWPIDLEKSLIYPDWVAGMFMLFPSALYKEIGGFDENYFLYYEDVDICRRIRNRGYQVALCTQVEVIHNAQRTSRKNIKYMFWHLKSLFRYLFLNSK